MSRLSTYDSTKNQLPGLLAAIKDGEIQLPEFQRDWVRKRAGGSPRQVVVYHCYKVFGALQYPLEPIFEGENRFQGVLQYPKEKVKNCNA